MTALAYAMLGVGGIISLVCFILVVSAMFKHNQSGLGTLCIVLIFCGGIGGLVAFVYGWVKASEWKLRNIMLAWTGALVLDAIGYAVLLPSLGAGGLGV